MQEKTLNQEIEVVPLDEDEDECKNIVTYILMLKKLDGKHYVEVSINLKFSIYTFNLQREIRHVRNWLKK